MNKIVLVVTLFIAIQFTQSQDYKFGKVSKTELNETENRLDPEANATVLYRKQYIHFVYVQGEGFLQKNEIHERIKIYNKDGFNQATKVISLYNESNDSEQELIGLKAVTYNLEGGKISETKLKKDGIFVEETNKYWKTKKFTMPNIKEGSVIEYKYIISSPFLQVGEIDFQQQIPIKKLDFKFSAPEYFVYKQHMNLKADFYPKLIESKDRGIIRFTNKSRTEGNGFSAVKTSFESSNVEFTEHIVLVNEENIPALKQEPMVSNLEIYKAQVLFELNYTKWPNEPMENYATTWEKVSKKIYQYPEFGAELKKSSYYKNDIDALLSGINDPSEKVHLIYNFVKSNVKWNGFEGFYAYDGVRKAYKDHAGNVADINLMLVSMLRYAGLDANPVLVSTRDNGIPLYPTRNGFNYVIGSVQLENGYVLLDATDKFLTVNTLPTRALNWQGRLIRKDGTSSWVALNPNKPSKELTSLNVKINSDLSIEGKVRNHFTDYRALSYRDEYENHSDEEMIESLQEDSEIEISNFEVKNKDDLSKPILQSYDYNYSDAIEQIGDKLYFSPLLFLKEEENPFKQESRKYPIDFIYPREGKYIVSIMLPEGYIVESLPEKSKIVFNVDDGVYSCLVRQNGKMIQLTMDLKLNKTLILPSDYEVFKQFYQIMLDKQSEKIVLSKAI